MAYTDIVRYTKQNKKKGIQVYQIANSLVEEYKIAALISDGSM
jgi:hypothetical protein